MPFLRKYGVLTVTGTTAIRIPMIKRGVVDFAVGADWTPASGDVKILVDGTAAANVTNLPTAIAAGNGATWEFVLTAAELSCKQCEVVIADSATKAVEDNSFIVETYGNASAMYVPDYSAALATPTNITGGTITTVTNLTNAPTAGDLTATMKTSVTTAATAATPVAASVTAAVALTTSERNSVADAVLDRDMSTGTDSGSTTVRTPRQALRLLRNKAAIAGGTLTVKKEDDATTSWTAVVATTAGDPVSSIDPAGP